MGIVANLWRHPIKGVGREELASVNLAAGRCMPMDRHWAIAHETAKVDFENPEWARCINFARGARGYELMAVASQFDDATGLITLSHPKLETITLDPETDGPALVNWVAQIRQPRPRNARTRIQGGSRHDRQFISIAVDPRHRIIGRPIKNHGQKNWINAVFAATSGWMISPAWSEFDWLGKSIRIGTAEFEITKPV